MKINKLFLMAIVSLLAAALALGGGCRKYDTNALWDEFYSQTQRVAALQTKVNDNITALQGLVTALDDGRHITNVEEITDEPGGWRITFSSGEPRSINIRNGATPQIGVKKDVDDVYYWTLANGNWLLDGDSNQVPVVDPQGAQGDLGIAPQLRINANTNEWEVCVTGECTDESEWTSLGVKATGPQGGAIVGVDADSYDDYVVFTLAAGNTTIQVPKYKPIGIGITFAQPETFMANTTQTVPYTLTGDVQLVKVIDVPEGWKVQVTKAGDAGGSFTITAPSSSHTGEALVIVASAEQTLTRVLRLPFTPTYAASAQTWTFDNSTLLWSDAIQIPECKAATFTDSDDEPHCRSHTEGSNTWYYYNWAYMNTNAATLCPDPWHVPTKDDFYELVRVTTERNLSNAWGFGGFVADYGVEATWDGFHWSSTEDSNGDVYKLYCGSGALSVDIDRKLYGYQIRCVK